MSLQRDRSCEEVSHSDRQSEVVTSYSPISAALWWIKIAALWWIKINEIYAMRQYTIQLYSLIIWLCKTLASQQTIISHTALALEVRITHSSFLWNVALCSFSPKFNKLSIYTILIDWVSACQWTSPILPTTCFMIMNIYSLIFNSVEKKFPSIISTVSCWLGGLKYIRVCMII